MAPSARFARAATLVFGAGALGALANSVAVWLAGALSLTGALGVAIAPAFTPSWLYGRLVWGGLWGSLFLLPRPAASPWKRGVLFSLAPTLVQLLVVFPLRGPGLLGLELGGATPAFVLFFNAVWGLVAASWLSLADARRLALGGTSS